MKFFDFNIFTCEAHFQWFSYKEHDMSGHALPPPRPETPFWSIAADEEFIYAKKEIVNAPLVSGDPDLYAPLFQCVSIFKRCYELMESLLKVFIYDDGAYEVIRIVRLCFASVGGQIFTHICIDNHCVF